MEYDQNLMVSVLTDISGVDLNGHLTINEALERCIDPTGGGVRVRRGRLLSYIWMDCAPVLGPVDVDKLRATWSDKITEFAIGNL